MVQWDKNNKKLFVPKKIGYGWTLNMAHPLAWVIVLIFVLLIGTAIYLGTAFTPSKE